MPISEKTAPPAGEGEQALAGWRSLLAPEWIPSLSVLLGGVLLHSMNVLLVATVLPSIVNEVGGAALMSWPTTGYLASSIVAATCTGRLTASVGPGRTFAIGALIFCAGTLLCAFAPTMGQVILGRFVQGFGGGVLSAVAYVLVRGTFPERLWPRVFALLASIWSISVLVGPLVGGVFATYGSWRGAFLAVTGLGGLLALGALQALPTPHLGSSRSRIPGGQVVLIGVAIATMSLAAIAAVPITKAALIVAAVAALAVALRMDRAVVAPVMPSDAFSLHSATGVGLWVAVLLSITFVPLQIYVPVFLQRLHGLDPLAAGYMVAGASMAWTVAAIAVSGLPHRWAERIVILGPLTMGGGMLGLAMVMPAGSLVTILAAIVLVGAGIGACWAFIAQAIMRGARRGEENIAASSVATVQQTGYAVGAAVAGLVANTVGFSVAGDTTGTVRAAFWVPATFTVGALLAGIMGVRLGILGATSGDTSASESSRHHRRRGELS